MFFVDIGADGTMDGVSFEREIYIVFRVGVVIPQLPVREADQELCGAP